MLDISLVFIILYFYNVYSLCAIVDHSVHFHCEDYFITWKPEDHLKLSSWKYEIQTFQMALYFRWKNVDVQKLVEFGVNKIHRVIKTVKKLFSAFYYSKHNNWKQFINWFELYFGSSMPSIYTSIYRKYYKIYSMAFNLKRLNYQNSNTHFLYQHFYKQTDEKIQQPFKLSVNNLWMWWQ